MSKSVKISDDVYCQLVEFQGKHETFSASIARLLAIAEKLGELRIIAGGVQAYGEYLAEHAAAKKTDE